MDSVGSASTLAWGLVGMLAIALAGVVAYYRAQLRPRDIAPIGPNSTIGAISGLEQRLTDWYQNSPIGFHTLDAQGLVTEVNNTELRWVGYRREEVVGKMNIAEVLTEESKKTLARSFERVLGGGGSANVEYEVIRKDGSTFHVLVHDVPLRNASGEIIGYHASVVDITQRKRGEEDLRMSEATFARAQALAQVGHYEIDLADSRHPTGGHWSLETYRILGRDPALGAMTLQEFVEHCVHPDDRTAVQQSVKESMTAEHETELEFRVVHPDRTTHHVKAIGHYFAGLGDRPDKLFGVLMDITDLKLAQEKIIRSERRFRAMIEKSEEAIALFWEDGTIAYASPSLSRVLGFPPEEMIGRKVGEHIHPEDRPTVTAQAAQIMSVPGSSVLSQFRSRNKAGEWRWIESIETNRLHDPDVDAVIANFRDITARKEMELALSESNARLRELSAYLEEVQEKERAAIAQALHDEVGQHYAGLQMGIHWLEQRHGGDAASVERTKLMRQLMTRAFGTIRNLIHSLHPPMLDDLGLVGALEALVEDVSQQSNLKIKFTHAVANEALPKPHQLALFRGLQESLTNVSRHAHADRVWVHLEGDGTRVILLVQDNGRGMVVTERQKRGSFGLLGMSERVKALGGNIEIRSTLGAGTTVRLSVPIENQPQTEPA
jgi:PAS domain S-box-containing protein